MIKFIFVLIVKRPDFTLLFVSQGWGFKEKEVLARLANIFNSKVVLAPRSGLVENHVIKNKNFSSIIKSALSKSDILICQSQYWKSFYSKFNKNSNLRFKIVNNWLDIEYYKQWTATESKSNKDQFTILFLGAITENKGVFDLIEAFKNVKNKSIKLHLCGNGDAYEKISQLIEEYDLTHQVTLFGWVSGKEKMNHFINSDVFILPSYREGYPNAIIEAVACNLPVITTNTGAISEVIEHKKNGYLVNPGNPDEIVEAINWYKEKPDRMVEISRNGLIQLEKRNSIKGAVDQFENIFCES